MTARAERRRHDDGAGRVTTAVPSSAAAPRWPRCRRRLWYRRCHHRPWLANLWIHRFMDPKIRGPEPSRAHRHLPVAVTRRRAAQNTTAHVQGSVDARICGSTDLWIHESVHGATTSGEAQDGATTARRCHDDAEMSLELWTQGSVDPWICGSTDLLIHKSVDGATTPGGGQDDATTARRRQDSAATFF